MSSVFQRLFGFKIREKTPRTIRPDDFIDRLNNDNAIIVHAAGDQVLHSANFSAVFDNEKDLIDSYRRVAENNYVNSAIDDIVNEAIDYDEFTDSALSIDLSKTGFSESIKKTITEEFEEVLRLLSYSKDSEQLFREWFIDGKHYFYITVGDDPRKGIKQIRKLDSRYIKRVKKISFNSNRSFEENLRTPDSQISYIFMIPDQSEHELSWLGQYKNSMIGTEAVEITEESIAYSDSGRFDYQGRIVSRLTTAIPWANKLSMLEDSLVIYRVSRAPERRAFYVDVGDLQPNLVEEYISKLISKFKTKATYNSATGLMSEQYEVKNMMEDIWLPRKDGKSTEVQSLAGGANLGELDDVEYFKRALYKAMKIPISRLTQESQYNLGRAAEISRDEVKFSKYIRSLLKSFSNIFSEFLKRQLILKNVITVEEWNENKNLIKYDFARNSYFEELKRLDMLSERLTLVSSLDSYVGNYIDKKFVWTRAWGFDDNLIEEMKEGIKKDALGESGEDFSPEKAPGDQDEGLQTGEEDFSPDLDNDEDFSPDTDSGEIEDFSPRAIL